jgi:hypothetical protein
MDDYCGGLPEKTDPDGYIEHIARAGHAFHFKRLKRMLKHIPENPTDEYFCPCTPDSLLSAKCYYGHKRTNRHKLFVKFMENHEKGKPDLKTVEHYRERVIEYAKSYLKHHMSKIHEDLKKYNPYFIMSFIEGYW